MIWGPAGRNSRRVVYTVPSDRVPSRPPQKASLLGVSPLSLAHGLIPPLGSMTSAICALIKRSLRRGILGPKLTTFKAMGYMDEELNTPSIWLEKRRRKAPWVPVIEC